MEGANRADRANGDFFRRIFFVYLTHIICFATANRTASDIRYYVSSNILRIFVGGNYMEGIDGVNKSNRANRTNRANGTNRTNRVWG